MDFLLPNFFFLFVGIFVTVSFQNAKKKKKKVEGHHVVSIPSLLYWFTILTAFFPTWLADWITEIGTVLCYILMMNGVI